MSKVTNVLVNLGPRLIMVGKEALGTSDNISLHVAESTEEELEKLKTAHEIRLVKMPAVSEVPGVATILTSQGHPE